MICLKTISASALLVGSSAMKNRISNGMWNKSSRTRDNVMPSALDDHGSCGHTGDMRSHFYNDEQMENEIMKAGSHPERTQIHKKYRPDQFPDFVKTVRRTFGGKCRDDAVHSSSSSTEDIAVLQERALHELHIRRFREEKERVLQMFRKWGYCAEAITAIKGAENLKDVRKIRKHYTNNRNREMEQLRRQYRRRYEIDNQNGVDENSDNARLQSLVNSKPEKVCYEQHMTVRDIMPELYEVAEQRGVQIKIYDPKSKSMLRYGDKSDPVPVSYCKLASHFLAKELEIYSREFFETVRLKRIVIGNKLTIYDIVNGKDTRASGYAGLESGTMVLSATILVEEYLSGKWPMFQHEIYHFYDYYLSLYERDPEFANLNYGGFRYGNGAHEMIQSSSRTLNDAVPGVIRRYGQSSILEDKADLFCEMVFNPDSWDRFNDDVLRNKGELIKSRVERHGLDESFWKSAKALKMRRDSDYALVKSHYGKWRYMY